MSSGGEGLGITGSLADAHSHHPSFRLKLMYHRTFEILKEWAKHDPSLKVTEEYRADLIELMKAYYRRILK